MEESTKDSYEKPDPWKSWTGGSRWISNTNFISNAMLKLAKNQANPNQHPNVELLLFENYSHSYQPRIISHIIKISKEQMYLHS